MDYTLMHSRTAVAELEIEETTGNIIKIRGVYEAKHLPVGISYKKGVADRGAMNEWWADRSIPATRSGVREALEVLRVANTKMLLLRCFGLSLSDQYWIRPAGTELTWDKINFFDNAFSDDIGDVLFGQAKKENGFDFSSPDNTSDGCLKKRWKIIDGKRCLIKGGSNLERQQPFNEVIASKIMERLNIPHVPYTLMWSDNQPYSVCEDFITADTELISAWRIMQTQKKSNDISVYRHFINCCKELGAPDIVPDLDKMIVLDFIIGNEDRHLNNFGLLRNAETLEWLGFAPIYDSGSSLGYDKLASEIKPFGGITCKPFKKHHEEQLKLVSDFSWLNLENLKDVGEMIEEVFSDERAQERVGEKRIKEIIGSVKVRVEYLGEIKQSYNPSEQSTADDVEEDIAEDYIPRM